MLAKYTFVVASFAALTTCALDARADEYPATTTPPVTPPSTYSLPWQLRPVTVATGVRSDTSFAKYEDAASRGGFTVASTLLASFKIPGTGPNGAGLAPLVRFAAVNDSPPTGNGGLAIVNPLVGASYAIVLGGGFRASFFLGFTIPVGMGGGDKPDVGVLDARTKGASARMAMDNSLFAVNDFAGIPGVDVAYVDHGLTLQLEATLFELTRVRGAAAQQEATKTNLTTGAHVGYAIVPQLTFGADIRYQRWLNAPISVDKDGSGTLVDTWSMAIGPRLHLRLGESMWIRPGVAYSRALDKPLAGAAPNYSVLQVDVPFVF
jgi:hypothetical protein